ncbi:hypothetical protein Tco_1232879 [Tanacetum coccineum]
MGKQAEGFVSPKARCYSILWYGKAKNYVENQIVCESRQEDLSRPKQDVMNENTEEKKYVFSLHKIHATSFPEEYLEEKLIRWVSKVFKTFNEEARLSIQHWKDTWHKRMYKIKHKKVKDDPEEVFSDYMISEVVRVTTKQQYGLNFVQQIIVMRENDKLDSFSEADFKYLNKNDIEACDPYSIVDEPSVGLIYLNIKEEKRIIDLVDISKFCDTTREKVLKEVKLKTEFQTKTPFLGELDLKIMKSYEREIMKRLNHRKQMRR